MPLMGSLYIGTSGLQTSQNALNTTAHNLSNMDTAGFVRQQVQQSTKTYVTLSKNFNSVSNQEYGLGVNYSCVKHVRDFFLDKSYRKESGRSSFYEVSTEALEEVENLLGELEGEDFQTTITDFWTAIQELAKDPSNSVNQGLLVQKASELIEYGSAVYDGLSNYQDNLNTQVLQQITKINAYGEQIVALNDQIRTIEAGGVENANDLRDTRDTILDELASLTDIKYSEDEFGAVNVQIEGVEFVKGSTCYQIDVKVDSTTGFYTPFWPQNAKYTINAEGQKEYNIDGAEVFDLTRTISSDYNTDIGKVKAMLLARGDHRADYTDIADGNYSNISQSVIMNVQAEFDQMIHNMVTKINEILTEAAGPVTQTVYLADGTEVTDAKVWAVDSDGYLRDSEGKPIQLFDKITTDSYTKVTDADGKEYWMYNEESSSEQDSLYTLSNLQVSKELMQNPYQLGFIKSDGSVDYDTTTALKEAFSEDVYTLNPSVQKKTNFVNYYTDLVSQVANSGSIYKSIYESQESTVESIESAREQIMGVSSDEELSNMIKFQNSYNAASRYINAVSEMLEHIISKLG